MATNYYEIDNEDSIDELVFEVDMQINTMLTSVEIPAKWDSLVHENNSLINRCNQLLLTLSSVEEQDKLLKYIHLLELANEIYDSTTLDIDQVSLGAFTSFYLNAFQK